MWGNSSSFGWVNFTSAVSAPFTNQVGNMFFLFIFAIPFLMQWLRQENMVIPCVIGIMLGGTMLGFMPAGYHLAGVALLALSVTGILYTVYKERR